jgi:hypothetical protein
MYDFNAHSSNYITLSVARQLRDCQPWGEALIAKF